jgi:hypothetical protein
MAMTTKRLLRRAPLFANLAFSSFHDWLPGISESNSKDFVLRSRDAGVSRIAFLRHGKTAKAENGVDFDRLLTDEGREQAKEAGLSFGKSLQPFYPVTLVSPAPRTMETANIFLQATGATESTRLTPVQSLYDGTMQPKGSQLFQKLGYAPLRDYLDSDDATDRQVARKLLGAYAHTAVDAISEAMEASSSLSASTTAGSAPTTRKSTLCIFGHAIYLPAAALAVASLADCDKNSIEILLSTSTREAEGYLIDFETSKIQYLARPPKN